MLNHVHRYFITLFALLVTISVPVHADTLQDLFRHSNDPSAGNPKGKVTVVEFFDYQCSHCVNMVPILDAIVKANPDVRIVYKEFPIRGPMSEVATRAALAANKQGKYQNVSHAIFASQHAISEASMMDIAKANGLNTSKLKKDMYGTAVNQQLKNNFKLAEELGITGTPAFFIAATNVSDNNKVMFALGEMSQSELQNAIDKTKKQGS